ncbi:MAG: hypothetical protein II614_02710 [Ruminococcus sp.]|nr:hypothetical protein [Ruminococcus sp.]
MKRLKCEMCGGDIIADEEQASAVCPYCGNIQRVIVPTGRGQVNRGLLREQSQLAARDERSAVSAKRANWEGRLSAINIEIQKRHSENAACVLKAQKTEQQFPAHCIACVVILLIFTVLAVFAHWYIFAAICAVPVVLILVWRVRTLLGCRGILAQFGRTDRRFDTISDPLLASEKIRKANPKRLRQIMDENDAYVEKLRAEYADVERRVEVFTRYLNLTESDVASLIFAMRCAEAGVNEPTDERLRAVRDKALAEMKTVSLGSSRTFQTRPY